MAKWNIKLPFWRGDIKQIPCGRPLANGFTIESFIHPLAEFLDGKFDIQPPDPPGNLGELLVQLKIHKGDLALLALKPILDAIYGGWDGDDQAYSEMRLCLTIGRYLHDHLRYEELRQSKDKVDRFHAKLLREFVRLSPTDRKGRYYRLNFIKSDWSDEDFIAVGDWLLCCALRLDYFVDQPGYPALSPWWRQAINGIRPEMMRDDPSREPMKKPPPDWTGSLTRYDDRPPKTFVKDWHPETKAAISKCFQGEFFDHAVAVNALQRTPLIVDQRMVPVVNEFAPKLMDRKHLKDYQREANQRVVDDDIATANYLADDKFWLNYQCDTRGRLYPCPHFSYDRPDHVRGLIRFANGAPLGADGERWLIINCANIQGDTAKKSLKEREKWVDNNRDLIRAIADKPLETFDRWKGAEKPFSFVAACLELAGAWADPSGFVTNLPISFDGSNNGLQHLSLLSRDRKAGRLVNLTDDDTPHDIYTHVAVLVDERLEEEREERNPWAPFWREIFQELGEKNVRKLVKTPVMTLNYAVSDSGMMKQILKRYEDFGCDMKMKDIGKAANYLGRQIRAAASDLLEGPTRVMEKIQEVAKYRLKFSRLPLDERFLRWPLPTEFVVYNRYMKANERRVLFPRDLKEVKYTLADGWTEKPDKKAIGASAANFVHSLDASHLVCTVNAAAFEVIELIVVHDCFASLAPNATRVNQLIRRELAHMYADHNFLGEMLHENSQKFVFRSDGELNPLEVINAKYAWA
jgi:hypothetical protein